MTAKLTPNLRLRNAKDFIENLVNHPITPPLIAEDGSHKVDRNHYMFIGRTKEWPTNLTPISGEPVVSEFSPPTPQNCVVDELDAREQMIALKKVRGSDATLVVRRYNWDESGNTIYAPYDVSDFELFNHPTPNEIYAANINGTYKAGSHYVITDDYHIFKCLSNGNGAKSTEKPRLPSDPPFTAATADGYVWKYLCTVTHAQIQSFLTNQWLPVKTLTDAPVADDERSKQWNVQASAVSGAIDSYIIKSAGNGYEHVLTGAFDAASASSAVLPEDDNLSTMDGAYVGCHVWITGGAGFTTGPFVVANYTASNRTITIDNTWTVAAGTTFEILPRVVITGNGTGATAKAIVDSVTKKVTSINRVDSGSGYTYASFGIIGGTTGSVAIAVPQVSPIGGHGSDIERELNASYVMLMVSLPFDDGSKDFPLSNDYRQIGLVRDVRAPDGLFANGLTIRASKGFKLLGSVNGYGGDFQPDEQIVGTKEGSADAKARIIAISKGPGLEEATIHYYQDATTGYNPFASEMIVQGSLTGANGTIAVGGLIPSEIDPLSGDILYLDNRRAVLRAPNQTEILRTVIKF